MAGSDERGLLDNRQVKYPGSPEWNAAFPNGIRWVQGTPAVIDGAKGHIPEPDTTRNPNTGNPWQGG
jgi:hypothetical protein